jgi:putative aminopeptidase FrvX
MEELDLDLFGRLVAAPGVSGREEAVRKLFRRELEGLVDDVSVDSMGNVVGVRRGNGGPTVMVASHMDEVGFLVKHIEDGGFLRVPPVGGIFPQFLPAQRVRVHCADGDPLLGVLSEPSELAPNTEAKIPKVEEFFVDVGLSKEEAAARVTPGDAVTMDRLLERSGNRVVAKAIDDRVGLFIIIEVLRRLSKGAAEVVAVGTAQEEIGTRGSIVAAHRIPRDVAVAVDTTLARDIPGVPAGKAVNRLGDGVSVKIMDQMQITNARLLQFARDVAAERGIRHQLEVGLPGGTDAGSIELAGDGSPAIGFSIPCRYPHTASEMADLGDIAATEQLLEAFLGTITREALRPE